MNYKNSLGFLSSTKTWRWFMYIILLSASLLKLLLASGQHLYIIGYASFDDQHFINLASYILHGQWLGPYNNMTLIKGPFYPIFLAANHLTHLPILFSEQLFYIFSCLLFLISIYFLINGTPQFKITKKTEYLSLAFLGLFLIFNPISTDVEPATRVIRNGIYPSLTLITVSLFIILLAKRKARIWKLGLVSVFTGLAFSCFWLTREDGIWLMPLIILLVIYSALIVYSERKELVSWKWIEALLFLPLLILWFSIYSISAINYHYYGVRATTEVQSPQFMAAYSSLTRVKSGQWLPVIPVSKADLSAIYKVSPAFAKLKPYLQGSIGKGWVGVSESTYPQYKGQIAGGWFMWAFRDSVQAAGYYTNGPTAMNYYSTLAKQVNAACSKGKITCVASTDNLYPPLTGRYFKPFVKAMGRSFTFLTGFQQYNPTPPNISGTNQQITQFTKITNESATNYNDENKINFLIDIGNFYQTVFPILTYAALIFACMLMFIKKSYKNPLFILMLLLAVGILIRMILLSLVTVTSFPGINTLYFACAYPLLISFVFISIVVFFVQYRYVLKGIIHFMTKKNSGQQIK